jgi:hypothetical protein
LEYSLLNCPLHDSVRDEKRRDGVKHLVPRPAHDVPEALGDEIRHGALSVGAQDVRCDAFAGTAAAFVRVAPGADVPSVCAASARVWPHGWAGGGCEVVRAIPGGRAVGGERLRVRRAETYVALWRALGSEEPPAIVKMCRGGWGLQLGVVRCRR